MLHLHYHNARMNEARKIFFQDDTPWDLETLINIPDLDPQVQYKCRFLYNRDKYTTEFLPYTRRKVRTLKLVNSPAIDYHLKYTDRAALEKIRQENPAYDDVVIAQNNRITDCTFANIVFFDGGRWVTPAFPLLKGTKRQQYLDKGIIFEEDILVSDLNRFDKIRLINAMIDLEESDDVEIIIG